MTFRIVQRTAAMLTAAAGLFLSACHVEYDARAGAARIIGVSMPANDTAFTRSLEAGLRDAATRRGYELSVLRARNFVGQQSAMDGFVTQHVDAIIVVPTDTARIVPALSRASAMKVPVFTLRRTANGRTQGVQAIGYISDYFDGKRVPTRRNAVVRIVDAGLRPTP